MEKQKESLSRATILQDQFSGLQILNFKNNKFYIQHKNSNFKQNSNEFLQIMESFFTVIFTSQIILMATKKRFKTSKL